MATKWTSAIVSRFLGLNIAPAIRSNPAASVRVAAHTRSYASADKSLSSEHLETKKQEANMRRAEKQRLRYQSDPEFREKIKQASRKRYTANSTNPEYMENRRRYFRERYSTDPEVREARKRYFKEKYATDPEYRENHLRRRRERHNDSACRVKDAQRAFESWRAKKAELEQDPEAYKLWRSEQNENTKVSYLRNTEYRWNQIVRQRHRNSARFRDEVIWRHHELVDFPIKMDFHCATCGDRRWRGGLKVWWRRKNESEKYDCFPCFQADREASTPVYYPSDLPPLPDRGPVE